MLAAKRQESPRRFKPRTDGEVEHDEKVMGVQGG
jgi:hypothetical protein